MELFVTHLQIILDSLPEVEEGVKSTAIVLVQRKLEKRPSKVRQWNVDFAQGGHNGGGEKVSDEVG